jgi:hypothetical protein
LPELRMAADADSLRTTMPKEKGGGGLMIVIDVT